MDGLSDLARLKAIAAGDSEDSPRNARHVAEACEDVLYEMTEAIHGLAARVEKLEQRAERDDRRPPPPPPPSN